VSLACKAVSLDGVSLASSNSTTYDGGCQQETSQRAVGTGLGVRGHAADGGDAERSVPKSESGVDMASQDLG
jgi:hypothetical protein